MSEIPIIPELDIPTFSRRARLEDFLDDCDENNETGKKQYNKNHSHSDTIAKNQQEFGHKKRIKP